MPLSRSTWARATRAIRLADARKRTSNLQISSGDEYDGDGQINEFLDQVDDGIQIQIRTPSSFQQFSFSLLSKFLLCDLIDKNFLSKAQLNAVIIVFNRILSHQNVQNQVISARSLWRKATNILPMEYYFFCINQHSHGPFSGAPQSFKEFRCRGNVIVPKLDTGLYFIKISIAKQLAILMPHLSQHLIFNNQSEMMDIRDAKLASLARRDNSLTLTLFTDEVPISNSSKLGCIPVYVIVNEIHRGIREKNAILVGVYVGRKKPDCSNVFLSPIVNELREIEKSRLSLNS